MRRELLVVAAIVLAALGIRIYPAWAAVFGREDVNFLETDAWYHVRLAENQVRNFPWRVTFDPYAAPGGQFVPIAPLYDTLTSALVVLLHGRGASASHVERIAAFVPPLLGALSVVAVWALARRVYGPREGLLAAAFLAVLPGHFMDRTTLGFVDHHALEALLAVVTLVATIRRQSSAGHRSSVAETTQIASSEADSLPASGVVSWRETVRAGVPTGIALGLYLLAWASGAFFIAILGAWLVLTILLARDTMAAAGIPRMMGVAAGVALLIVVGFQDPRMHRYGSQVIGLVGLAVLALVLSVITSARFTRSWKVPLVGTLMVVGAGAALVMWIWNPALVTQILLDVTRLAPNPARMNVLEARPLFLYQGEWRWEQPWLFFRTGFFVGVAGLLLLTGELWRQRRPADALVWVFGVVTLAATIGQNRFGYYFVPACAIVGGWLAGRILDWPLANTPNGARRVRLPMARELAVAIVAGVMFAPNLSRGILLMPRSGGLAEYWQQAMTWIREHTPEPFAGSRRGDDYYLSRYTETPVPLPDYSIMNWWDQGYWLMQRARRVPVANPTQERAGRAARFYAETDEQRAAGILAQERSRYVLSDWELPFRLTPRGEIMGRFESIADWAGAPHSTYYEIFYRRASGGWTPVWVFHEPYYRSMAYRLTVLGGARAIPRNSTSVVTVADRTDRSGLRFREVLSERTFPAYEQALVAVAADPNALIVGLDPWQTAFPLEGLTRLVERHAVRTPEQKAAEAPWVRVFEYLGRDRSRD